MSRKLFDKFMAEAKKAGITHLAIAQPEPAQVEALQQRFIDYQRDERGRTVAEVVYWRQQYKQLAADAIAALRPQAAPEQPHVDPAARSSDAVQRADGGGAVLSAILRCRYPVDSRIRAAGFDWDIPRLEEVVAALSAAAIRDGREKL